ncbi:hypothetical protein OS914_15935 [Arthrobacter sp. H14-L1]|nr:hypothetical protein [Arthrobacter sp. H14-L1]
MGIRTSLEWTWLRGAAAGYYGRNFNHPHLRGGTNRDWPLNAFTPAYAEQELPTLRAIASAEIHNLVFIADYMIVPTSKPGTRTSTR